MNIIITIPDEQEQRLLNKISKHNGWTNKIVSLERGIEDNPLSKKDFIKQLIINFLKKELRQAERQEALESIASNDVELT